MGELLRAHGGLKGRFTVALTGGIGSGKSTVAEHLREMGAAVLDADALTHELYQPGGEGAGRIAALLGSRVLDARGAVDRERLGALLFTDAAIKRRVEEVVHPLVIEEVERWLAELPKGALPVVEVALLFESGMQDHFACVVVVSAPERAQLARLLERNPDLGEAGALRRIASQMPLSSKVPRAHVVIDNAGSLEELRAACQRLGDDLIEAKREWEK